MCGIAGFLGEPIDERSANAALNAIAHRGPDDKGIFRDGPALLLHRRLSIIDVTSRAHQPMVDAHTGVTIVFNGEIYNYQELRKKYDNVSYRTDSDTEVALMAYLKRGLDFVHDLRGMFAMAIWDPREGRLHLVRDRFGIKPLYWWKGKKGLAFGSEVKAILALGVAARLDLDTTYDYLAHGLLAHCPRTFFAGVEEVPAGTILSVDISGRLQTRRYWSPMEHAGVLSPSRDTPMQTDPEKVLWELFQETVALHTVSDVPVGVTLSSGLDSRFLLHALAANGWKDIDAFTYGFAEEEYDEIRRIDLSSLPLNVRHHTLSMRADETIASLEEAVRIFEVPIGGVGTLGVFGVMKIASERGIKVILAGEGSDETFAGYRYYGYSRLRDLYDSQSPSLNAECQAFSRLQGEPLAPGTPAFEDRVVKRDSVVWAPDGTVLAGEPFLGEALDDCRAQDSWARSRDWHPPLHAETSHLRAALIRDIFVQKIPKLLWFQDRASMAWGVESRVPFLDHRLYEFVGTLDDEWLIKNGITKYILRRLYSRFCNIELTQERKHFVSTPQREWIKGPLREEITQRVRDGYLVRHGLIDRRTFEAGYDAYCASPELGNSFFIWKVLNLELLLSSFF